MLRAPLPFERRTAAENYMITGNLIAGLLDAALVRTSLAGRCGACSPLLAEQAGIDRLDAGGSPQPLPPRCPAPSIRVVLSREPVDP